MELATIVLLLAVLIIVIMFVAKPFIERWRPESKDGKDVSPLLAERDRILSELQELDFDSSLGKIPADEYSSRRTVLLQQGAEVLRRLDDAQRTQAAGKRGVEAKSSAQAAPARSLSDDELEDMLAARRVRRKEKAVGFCPKCGKPVLQSDRFCPSCGQAVK